MRIARFSWGPVAAMLVVSLAASATEEPDGTQGSDPHAHHRAAAAAPPSPAQVARRGYDVPDVTLSDENGRGVRLRELMASGRPLAVNFIFTSCTSICPVMTTTMLQVQRALAGDPDQPTYVSISIDPQYDSAQVLKSYAEKYGAEWTFLTGAPSDVVTVLRAFDAYRGGKMNHAALTLLRVPNATEWIRVEGLVSAGELTRLWHDAST